MLARRTMATLTIRNVPPKLVRSLKVLARENGRSMEQEVRNLIAEYVGERLALMDEIEASWERQARRPEARDIDEWIEDGRT
jgi:plasmid stability protein